MSKSQHTYLNVVLGLTTRIECSNLVFEDFKEYTWNWTWNTQGIFEECLLANFQSFQEKLE